MFGKEKKMSHRRLKDVRLMQLNRTDRDGLVCYFTHCLDQIEEQRRTSQGKHRSFFLSLSLPFGRV